MLEKCPELEEYTVFFQIGEGQYGTVYKALDRTTATLVAIKVISKQEKSKDDLEMFYKEINILSQLQHPHIIQLLKSLETEKNIYIITEYCKSDLLAYAAKRDYLRLEEIRTVALQLLSGLKYLHSRGLVHHDIKTQNILVGGDGRLKICDFGLVVILKSDNQATAVNRVKGTLLYMAPELILRKNYSYKIDFWSLGVVLYELFVGKPPFDTSSTAALKEKIILGQIIWPKSISDDLRDLISKLLTKDQEMRISWEDLIAHKFLHSNTIENTI